MSRKSGRNSVNSADGYREAPISMSIAAEPEVEEEAESSVDEDFTAEEDGLQEIDEIELPNIVLDDTPGDEDSVDEPEDEDDFFEDDEEEEEEEEGEGWAPRGGRKKPKPTRPVKPVKKPKRDPRRSF